MMLEKIKISDTWVFVCATVCRSHIFFCFYGICVFNVHFTKLISYKTVSYGYSCLFLFENVSNIKTISRSCIYFPSTIAKYTQSNIWFKILI